MQIGQKLILPFLLFITSINGFGQTIVHAADYGVKANSFENAAASLQKAIAVCKTKDNAVLVLPD